MNTTSLRCLLALVLILPLSESGAETAAERGRRIAEEVERRDTGWQDMRADLEMILGNASGDESRRKLRTRLLEVEDDGDMGLSIFDAPADIKGTAFLSITHAQQPDDQWLYLPALKKTKRISSIYKSGPFVGSEFAYEDLISNEIEKFEYRWVKDETLEQRASMVIERVPRYEHSGYSRQLVWVDAEIYRPLKVEFYDRKNALLKTLVYLEYRIHIEQYWRPERMLMSNHQNGKTTELIWRNYEFRTGLSRRDFDRNVLKRLR